MTRSRKAARDAGSRMERVTAQYLAAYIDERIERRVTNGANDRGDISSLRVHGKRVVVSCKDTARTELGPWANDAEIQRGNDDAMAAVIVHKRHGKGQPGDQWVTCTLADFVALITGERPE